MITRDLDFANILNFPPENYDGIVVLRLPYFYSASQIKRAMKQFLENISAEEFLQSIIIVEEGKIRIRSYKTE